MLNRRRVVFIVSLLALAVMALVLFRANPPKDPTRPTTFVPAVWNAARLTSMHEAHVGKQKIECVKCHVDGFGESPGVAGCAGCHEAEAARAHRGAPDAGAATSCLTCHAFAAGVPARPCTGCHAASDAGPREAGAGRALPAHATGDATCGACHVAHGSPPTRLDVRAECTGCHDVRAAHGAAVAAPDPARERDAAAFADGGPDAGAAIQVCTTCHAPHTAKAAARGTCAACHSGKSAQPHDGCVACHQPHAATKADVRSCQSATCHGGKRPSAGHAACVTCHAPHAPTSAGSACKGCHTGVSALASATVPEHAACTSCHEPHARGEGTRAPALACVRCHADVHPAHPALSSRADPAGVGCTGC
ncbi:MAG TPA: cytochrome c3 family protein, partial [Polyangiaceae bacterium]|nr:cytochrome c3 family protein [Polyangiaceae bacterium]